MRICIDTSPAVHRRAGLGRYALELTSALLAADSDNEYVAFYHQRAEAQVDPPLDRLPQLTTNLSTKPWRMSALLGHLAHFPQDRLFPGIDLFHATDHLLPRLSRVKTVFTLHDLIFQFYPEMHKPLNRWFLTLMMPRFLRAADAVIAVSECTKKDAVHFYGIEEAKIHVVYEGVNPSFRPAPPETVGQMRRKYSLPDNFTLTVGTIEPRKNLTSLLEAYSALRQSGVESKLVIAGKKGWLYEGFFRRLSELGLGDEVVLPGFVPDRDLPALYGAADLFVFPSFYEGFGLPVLEAMACGVPVVTSNTSSLPEVAGDAAVLIDPSSVDELVTAMRAVLENHELRAELRAKGLKQAARFSWEKAAKETLAVYSSLVKN
ncbi:MAG: glycosyltransferase [Anaerolineae bacterium]|nr:glycosyltransferase [Anaerolineae bacterium]NIN94277.1 glycosyltransferase [Anaerolineae bacterium]NIQ77345.1 glycosyltransferase [Anaerolineae bacterium]